MTTVSLHVSGQNNRGSSIDSTGKIDLDCGAVTTDQEGGAAKPSSGGEERLHSQEEADHCGTLSHLVLFPVGWPLFFTLVGSTEIIPTPRDFVAGGQNISPKN